ncbi:DUF2383 domain-containing protein [Pseudoalteromonas ruthenica]|uniref:DUF2383 domain-containing protein n=1 Tax=Pseudoalteromonas ruthenica TaxID=151081 RepID=UPI0012464082|nr:DUF2383 domain-containing protein [Pseudoalteromonas ruthenica]
MVHLDQTQAKRDKKIAKDILKLNRDAATFYKQAAEQVGDYNVRHVFINMAKIREQAQLSVYDVDENPDHSSIENTWLGTAIAWYAQAKSHFSNRPEQSMIIDLIEFEKKLLAKIKKAVSEARDPALKGALASITADIQMCIDQLSACKPANTRSHATQ